MKNRSIIVMLILSFVTCGIYNLFWIYISRDEFKKYTGWNDINPGLELLFMLICFPYFYYWLYKFSTDIAHLQQKQGRMVTNNAIINLVLAILGFGLVSELIIQSQLNEFAE